MVYIHGFPLKFPKLAKERESAFYQAVRDLASVGERAERAATNEREAAA
jgi:hypothetical protein